MNNKVEILLITKGHIVDRKEIDYDKWELINLVDYFDLEHAKEFREVHGTEVVARLRTLFELP